MEGWAIEQLEWMTSKSKAQEILKLVTPEIRKDTLKEVAEHLEQHPEDFNYQCRWQFIARLKVGLLP